MNDGEAFFTLFMLGIVAYFAIDHVRDEYRRWRYGKAENRHPEYMHRYPTVCAEREPTNKPDCRACACTLRRYHPGNHRVETPDRQVVMEWSREAYDRVHH